MKNKMVFSLILTGVLFLAGNSGNVAYSQTIQNKQDTIKSVQYTCPMHPDVVQDMPGKCPKCGMQLVKKQNQNGGDLHNNDTTGMKKMMIPDSTDHMHQHKMEDYMDQMNHQMMPDSLGQMHQPMTGDITWIR